MKKEYNEPTLEISVLEISDILTTSSNEVYWFVYDEDNNFVDWN